MDVIGHSSYDGDVYISLGNGDGSFQNGQVLVTPIGCCNTYGMTLLNVNDDVYADLVLTDDVTNQVHIYVNDNGTFEFHQTLAASTGVEDVAAGDLNSDGRSEIILAHAASSVCRVYYSQTNGVYSSSTDIDLGETTPSDVKVALLDVNGNGNLDIVISGNTMMLYVMYNGGTSFTVGNDIFMGSFASHIISGDWDNDGDMDVAFATDYSGFVGTLINNNGTLSTYVSSSANGNPSEMVSGDFNNDGIVDILAACGDDEWIVFMKGNNTERFGPDFLIGSGTSDGFDVADFDSDGNLDVLLTNDFSPNYSITYGNGDVSFLPSVIEPHTLLGADDARSGDMNNDGDIDIVYYSSGIAGIMMGNGNGTFGSVDSYVFGNTGGGDRSLTLADLNNDDFPELLGVYVNSNFLYVGTNTGGGISSTTNYATNEYPRGVSAADLNDDTFLDVLVACDVANTVQVYMNNGSGGLMAPIEFPTGLSPRSIAVADFNNDGETDFASSNNNSENLTLVLQNNGGGFSGATVITVPSLPNNSIGEIAAGDLNGDGNIDIAAVYGIGDRIAVLFGNGNGTFQLPVTYDVDLGPEKIRLADINEDGDLDIITMNTTAANASVILNNSAFINVNGNTFLCEGETVSLSVIGEQGSSFLWSSGQTTPTIEVSGTGEYFCQISNQAGTCTLVTPSVNVQVAEGTAAHMTNGLLEDMCDNEGTIQLFGGSPQGGTYSGPGVTNGTFDPALSGTGEIVISYTYTDLGGCGTSVDSDTIVVLTAPVVTLEYQDFLCSNFGPYMLAGGSPILGVYEAEGINGELWYTESLEDGIYPLTYTYAAENGCSSSAVVDVEVQVCFAVEDVDSSIHMNFNPSTQVLSISNEGPISTRIYDAQGRWVAHGSGVSYHVFDTSLWADGVYVVISNNEVLRFVKSE